MRSLLPLESNPNLLKRVANAKKQNVWKNIANVSIHKANVGNSANAKAVKIYDFLSFYFKHYFVFNSM